MSQPTEQAKAAIRREMREALAAIDPAQHHDGSIHACERVAGLDPFRVASVIMLYMPISTELDVTPLALRCFELGKTVCVPRVDWDNGRMEPVEVIAFDDRVMNVDERGIRSPRSGRAVSSGLIDLIFVPGLAFDPAGHRLGRGGGYYDRFLPRLRPSLTKVGLAFDRQIVDRIPAADHDVPMDMVVTERRVITVHAARTRQERRH